MLFFAKLFGGENRKVPLELQPHNTIGDLRKLVVLLVPNIITSRILFSGRVLGDDEATLTEVGASKECVIQVQVRRGVSNRRNTISMHGIQRQQTMAILQFGDVLLISLVGARNLKDPNNDFLNPFITFNHTDQVQRSSLVRDSRDPDFHETFGFHISILGGVVVEETISVNVYNRNLARAGQGTDNHLGTAHIQLLDIPREQELEKVYDLENDGSVILSVFRYPLVSGDLVSKLRNLIDLKRAWQPEDLKEQGISLEVLVGTEPFTLSQNLESNHAINLLYDSLQNQTLQLNNIHTAAKARRILASQNAVMTEDEIGRYLWFSDLNITEEQLSESLYDQAHIKSIVFYTSSITNTGGFGFLTFVSKEAALLNLLHLKLQGMNFIMGFGSQKLCVNQDGQVQDLNYFAGFLQISTKDFRIKKSNSEDEKHGDLWLQQSRQVDGQIGWAVLSDGELKLYKRLQDKEPELTIELSNCEVTRKDRFVIYLKKGQGENEELIYIRSPADRQNIDGWYNALEASKDDQLDVVSVVKNRNVSSMYRLDKLEEMQTYAEIYQRFNGLLKTNRFETIATQYSNADLVDILTPQNYQEFLDKSLQLLMDSSDCFVKCPKCSAPIEVIPEGSRRSQEQEKMLVKLEGVNGEPLSEQAKIHFMHSRILCRNPACLSDFCAQCLELPYHLGMDCASFSEFKHAPRCRFCSNVIPNYQNKMITNENSICDKPECIKNNEISSKERLPCGHLSLGIAGEDTPCLVESCPARPQEINATSEDCCVICTSEIREAPILVLGCSHVFHYQCLKDSLEKLWPREYITFDFCSCPLCKKPLFHSALMKHLKSHRILQAQVISEGLNKMKQEGLDKHPDVNDRTGRFYKDPIGFCAHHYAFYQCHTCKEPYFGGARACGAEGVTDEINREDLVCSNCQNVDSVEECPDHGRQYIAFKCRYCCKLSVFHCWGKVHFCVSCHKSEVWDKLTTYATGKNKKKIEEYPQCKAIREQMDEALTDPKWKDPDNREELDEIFKDFHSNPETCPLNIRHRPNGYEFGLGCTMCADKDIAKKNEEVRKKAENEAKARMAKLMKFLIHIPNPKTFSHEHPMDNNGILSFFGTSGNADEFKNPAAAGMILISGSQLMKDSEPIVGMVGRELVRCVTIQDQSNPWFAIDFVDKFVKPSAYMLRHYESWDTECLRNWVFEGSLDGERWVRLKHHDNDCSLNKKGQAHIWELPDLQAHFRKFRVKQTGPNSNLHNYLACSGFDLYGDLHKKYNNYFETAFEDALKRQEEEEKAQRQRFWQKLDLGETGSFTFLYDHDMDEKGIIYFLGSKGGTEPFQNPADTGIVSVSSIGITKDSAPKDAVVGRTLVRCVTQPVENAWFCIDFLDKWIQPTLYTIRHYSSWDTECLRNWVLEGSNDGRRWEVVMRHVNDTSLNEKGATHTWPIPTQTRFSKWRIRQTGLNSNKHKYLACSGIEFYGKVFTMKRINPNVPKPNTDLDFILDLNHDGVDFGNSGLFYNLGTNFKRDKWKNPAERGIVKVTASSLCPDSEKASAVVGRTVVRCVTKPHEDSWFCVDLREFRLFPTAYSLRHYSSWDVEALRNWVFEGSNDNTRWNILGTYLNDTSLSTRGASRTWILKKSNMPYRYFRVRQIGPNSNKHLYLSCSGMELYGRLMRTKVKTNAPKVETAAPNTSRKLPLAEKENLRKHLEAGKGLAFRYHSDLDENGICYFLGTNWKTEEWKNPALMGVINVTSSRLAKDSVPAYAAVGRSVVRLVCFPERQNWFCIDFKDKYVRPTRYTLRHYSSWETEALRNWVLEGSVDMQRFQILREHRNDTKLYGIGATASWKLDVKGRYRAFRIRQFGLNSNNHLYLSISGFEIYGEMYLYPK